MKNKKRIALWAAFILVCAGFAAYYLLTRGVGDHAAPVISVPEGTLSLSVYAGDEALLEGVTAQDGTDGDVTASLVVETVSPIVDGNRATATVAAFDSAGNVAKAQREIAYTDYVRPRFTLSGPLIFRAGSSIDVFSRVGAQDAIDGSLDDRVKGTLLSDQLAVEKEGLYEVEFRVTNSLGDTAHLRLPVEVLSPNAAGRYLELTDYLVYLPLGADFDPMAYLTEDGRRFAARVESDVDTGKAGIYTVTYYSENRESYEKTRLMVVVEE